MYSDSENPPVAKLPFVLGDLALLLTAGLLAWSGPRPLDATTLLGLFACVALGAVLLAVPFLLEYSRRQEQLADERQAAMGHLVKTAAAAAEQASIAATSLHALARDTAEALAALQSPNPAPPVPDHRVELQALQEQVAQVARQLKPSSPPAAQEVLPPELVQRLDQLTAGIRALQLAFSRSTPTPSGPGSISAPEGMAGESLPAASPEPKKSRRGSATREVTGDTPPLFAAGLLNTDITLHEGDASRLAPELPGPTAAAEAPPTAPPAERAAPQKKETTAPPLEKSSAASPPAAPEPRVMKVGASPGDGATRLTVTAYIGIGNKLFLRGEGPGLSPTEGVPLQFVSIGKWRWESDATTMPAKVSVWKNDEQRCDVLGEFLLTPGQAHEVTADF